MDNITPHISINEAINRMMEAMGQKRSVKKEGLETMLSSPTNLPKTPPSKGAASRTSTGPSSSVSKERASFIVDDEEESVGRSSPWSSPSPSKLKSKARAKTTGARWALWEEHIILKYVLQGGEKGCAWRAVLAEINEKREASEPRTSKSVSCHWQMMKARLLDK